MNTTAERPLTSKQSMFLQKLVEERDVTDHLILGAPGAKPVAEWATTVMTSSTASVLIDWLLECPRKPLVHEDGQAVTQGYYLVLDTVYAVVPAKSTGNLYAKALTITDNHATWEYAPGAMRLLTSAHRMTIEQAKDMGHQLGRCIVCARELTDPSSVAAGIGPICVTRL